MNREQARLDAQRAGTENWKEWGPYLSERAWGTVREDYSPHGNAWEYLDHDQARSRAYRWSEDGLGGISDEGQHLCFALALWNGCDPILKERAFGLTGNQGNRGEDVKDLYFYTDATPSHSWLRYLYKYPQAEFPYARLIEENRRRSRQDPPFGILDTGIFDDGHYWDVDIQYARGDARTTHIRIIATNRGSLRATLHILPTLWFRNDWSWDDGGVRPRIAKANATLGVAWSIDAHHATYGDYRLSGLQPADLLFTENESNAERLWGQPNATPHVKDGFHERVIHGVLDAVNADGRGTKAAAWHIITAEAGESHVIDLVLAPAEAEPRIADHDNAIAMRMAEADAFYAGLLPDADSHVGTVFRQALAGMVWTKQFFHLDAERWLKGDIVPAPATRLTGRNAQWRHLEARDIISMPDAWEYPWFAAWDLAFHCGALALIDVDFAKQQIELLLNDRYMHPNGQIPAYEWAFGDVNPPVIGWAALKLFRAERVQRGQGDLRFLQRVLHKLMMNLVWWTNRKDVEGNSIFEGGFLGLDNISVFDRSQPLPEGFHLEQADATGWMAMFTLNLTAIALELTADDEDYEHIALHCYKQFLAIARAVAGQRGGEALWDERDGFFKDAVIGRNGQAQRIDVFSLVGLIPLFAVEVIDERLLRNAPAMRALLDGHSGGMIDNQIVCACPATTNARGEHLLSLVDPAKLPRILEKLLDEAHFLSPYGVRSLSRIHAEQRELGDLIGLGRVSIEYVPGESTSGLFGGNSNWRGPIWMPVNYLLIQSIEKFHRYYGDDFRIEAEALGSEPVNLEQVARRLSDRLVALFTPDAEGRIPALPDNALFHDGGDWSGLMLFPEYFHADSGQGVGAMHQTGWTGLIANLIQRQYRTDIPGYWRDIATAPSTDLAA